MFKDLFFANTKILRINFIIKGFNPKKNFTLIEALITSLIILILTLGLFSTFRIGILTYKRLNSFFNLYQTARIIFNRIELDLTNSFPYSDKDSKFNGTTNTLSFFSVTNSYKNNFLSNSILKINYKLENGILIREYFDGLESLKENLEPFKEELGYKVEKITFQYLYKTNDPRNPYEWISSWPIDDIKKGILPLAIKIKLSLIEENLKKNFYNLEFEKIIPIPLGG